MLQGFRTPAASATTSEPQVGNGPPGAPVTASMSDGFGRNQGGTVEYMEMARRVRPLLRQ